MSRVGGSCPFKIGCNQIAIAVTFALNVGTAAQAAGPSAHAAALLERKSQFTAYPPAIFGPSAAQPEPLGLPDTALEPIEWNALKEWSADDHAAAFATFLASCRPCCEAFSAGAKSGRCILRLSRYVIGRLPQAD